MCGERGHVEKREDWPGLQWLLCNTAIIYLPTVGSIDKLDLYYQA